MDEKNEEQDNDKTVWSFKKPTPKWAAFVFRFVFFGTLAGMIVVAGDEDIPSKKKVKILLYMKAFDVLIWGLAKGAGIDKKKFENEN